MTIRRQTGWPCVLAVVAGTLVGASAIARDIHVNLATGDDRANGAADSPVKTAHRGLRLASPGDTVHLGPPGSVYPAGITFHDRFGEPAKPITLDGHGVILEGSEPIRPDEWLQEAPGLFRNERLYIDRRMNKDVVNRYFFVFDGKMNLMGRSSKGPKAPFKAPENLAAGEWTFRESDHSFFLKIDPARSLAEYVIRAPVWSNGIALSSRNQHLVIRNLTATHVWNDGYNIHGYSRDILFENIQAIDCGDDGMSAHGDCHVQVDGFLSAGNSTGICNVQNSSSKNNRVVIRDCIGFDFYIIGANAHTLTNSVILSSAANPVLIVGDKNPDEFATVRFDNVWIDRRGGSGKIYFGGKSIVDVHRLTTNGFNVFGYGKSFRLTNSVIGGAAPVEVVIGAGVDWQSAGNRYHLQAMKISETNYLAPDFGVYQKATSQDAGSAATKIVFCQPLDGAVLEPILPADVGVDIGALPKQ